MLHFFKSLLTASKRSVNSARKKRCAKINVFSFHYSALSIEFMTFGLIEPRLGLNKKSKLHKWSKMVSLGVKITPIYDVSSQDTGTCKIIKWLDHKWVLPNSWFKDVSIHPLTNCVLEHPMVSKHTDFMTMFFPLRLAWIIIDFHFLVCIWCD